MNSSGGSVSDPRLELAYDAVIKLLSIQDGSLGNLRTRATGLLSVAALVTTFSTGLGLINLDPAKAPIFPTWTALLLLAILVVIGVLSMIILWPIRHWRYGANPTIILQKSEQEKTEEEIRRDITLDLISGLEKNRGHLRIRFICYQWAVIFLLVEVVTLVIAFIAQ
jgi:hypothetical protein